jgi:hypothetical protein
MMLPALVGLVGLICIYLINKYWVASLDATTTRPTSKEVY